MQPASWSGFEGSLMLEPDQQKLKVAAPKDLDAMQAYIMAAGFHIGAHDTASAKVVAEFMDSMHDMCMDDMMFQQLKLKLGPWESQQLAAVLTAGLPQPIMGYISAELPMSAGGLEVLRALLKPFRKQVGEGPMQHSTSAVLAPEPVEYKCDLMSSLSQWKQHLNILDSGGEIPSDMQLRQGLVQLVSRLGMQDDIDFEERMVKRAKEHWTQKKLLALVEEKAMDWVNEPRPKKGKAKGATGGGTAVEGNKPHCIHWLYKGWCSKKGGACRYSHDPAAKLRKDLIPLCPSIAKGRPCKFQGQPGACWYRHPDKQVEVQHPTVRQQEDGPGAADMQEFVQVAKDYMKGTMHDDIVHARNEHDVMCAALHSPTLKSCHDANASDVHGSLQAGQQGCHRCSVGGEIDAGCEGLAPPSSGT